MRALKHAAPYIRLYKSKIFVIKAGGEVFRDGAAMRSFMEQVALLHQVGIRVVLVHGGGPQLDELARQLGVADPHGAAAASPTADARRRHHGAERPDQHAHPGALPGDCICRVGISGVDGGLIKAHKRAPGEAHERRAGGFRLRRRHRRAWTGRGDRATLDNGLVPIVSPLSCDDHGHGAEHQRRHGGRGLATALGASKLILTGRAGHPRETVNDPRSLVSYLDLEGLRRLRKKARLAEGMLPKARAIEAAMRGGVPRVHLISYTRRDSLLPEIFTNEGTGTLVVADTKALTRGTGSGLREYGDRRTRPAIGGTHPEDLGARP